MSDFHVIVVGAGTAGCLAARDLARKGWRVGLFDAADEGRLHRPLIVEVERGAFKNCDVPEPGPNLVPYHPDKVRFVTDSGRLIFTFDPGTDGLPTSLHLDKFNALLLGQARDAGAQVHLGRHVEGPILDGGRVTGMRFSSSKEARAPLTIDATGFDAALVRRLPPASRIEFPSGDRHVVTAENRLFDIDPARAGDAVRQGTHGDNEVWGRFGTFGSYSTVLSWLSLAKGTGYILVGFKKGCPGAPTVGEAVDRFVAKQGWFAARRQSGGGLIRIRHSLDKMVADGFIAIGEAACTVVPIHGSGVASALYTGALAAKTAITALESGDATTAALWPYAAQYQRGRGRTLAGLDVTRLAVDTLSGPGSQALLSSGLLTREDVLGGLVITPPRIDIGSVPGRARGAVKHAKYLPLAARLGVTLARVLAHYAKFPARWDPDTFDAWALKKRRIFGALLPD